MNNEIIRAFFEIMAIAQKYYNAHMTGNTIDPETIDADALRVFNLAREIRRDNDTSGQVLNDALDARYRLVCEIADATTDYLDAKQPDGVQFDVDYSFIGANHSKEIDDYCMQVASVAV